MSDPISAPDFERMSWHDNIVYGMQFHVGDAFKGDWRHDLSFDIDYIAEWVRSGEPGRDSSSGSGMRFRVAPATLTFHEVTDLRIGVDFGDSDCATAITELSIAGITREAVDDPQRFPAGDYFRYRIGFNLPQGGEIAFGARGFTQTLRAAPVLCDEQRLAAGTPR